MKNTGKREDYLADSGQPDLSCKMKIIRLLSKINDERFINRIYVSVREYVNEGGGSG